MCKVFVCADPALYDTSTRSLRLHGVVTSIRLENHFWHVLGEIGQRDGLSVNRLITKLYDEIIEARGEVRNFTSFLRVCCLRYLSLQISVASPAMFRFRSGRWMRTPSSLGNARPSNRLSRLI